MNRWINKLNLIMTFRIQLNRIFNRIKINKLRKYRFIKKISMNSNHNLIRQTKRNMFFSEQQMKIIHDNNPINHKTKSIKLSPVK